MKKLIALITLLISTTAFANDYNPKTCAFVNVHKNFKVTNVMNMEHGKIRNVLHLTVEELNGVALVIKAFNLYDHFGSESTLDQVLDNVDPDGILLKKLVGKKSKKTYYYLDFYAGDNAAGFFVNGDATKILAENSDGDIGCL